ncbi:hypothetical protein [Synechococcus sp. PCC 7336]|uniref:hypothetical protein n=1 Tax=Synechococcus sp. PCC 7336 TaxID=195250 RepID=UPI00034DFF1D|nr:hypothetical protein [Synechococcus sp. PCC 7336]
MLKAPQTIYDRLRLLEQIDGIDVVTSASYRELAYEALTNPEVNVSLQQAIADRLHQANLQLGMQTVDGDSY